VTAVSTPTGQTDAAAGGMGYAGGGRGGGLGCETKEM
jgi:hypothetical protein